MVEIEKDDDRNTHGIAVGGLTTGIIGSALGLLNNGNLGGILGGGNNGCHEDHFVNRYEMNLQNQLAAKDTRISLLESNIYVDGKIAEVYERLNTKIAGIEAQIGAQAVVNAQVTANLACLQNTMATLSGLTKTVIPIGNVCPAPMPQFNSWTAPTTSTTTGA